MFSDRFYTFLNASIVIFSFIETYVFPFAVIKWVIVITKYGGLLTLLKEYKDAYRNISTPTLKSHYKYSLQLRTTSRSDEQRCLSHLSVIIEEMDNSKKIQLNYCGQDCQRIPAALVQMYGAKVQYLDLSYNNIETLKGIDRFHNLQELILDNNKLTDNVTLPYLPYLRTLSLNNNQITDLEGIIDKIARSYPNLTYLSLLSNVACPDQLTDRDKDDSDYQRYRHFVIYKLKNLRFLDSRRVTQTEHAEALTRGEFTRVRRPNTSVVCAMVPSSSILLADQRPMPVDFAALGKHKGAYGKLSYKYTGKHSEGNRFIVNSDL